jgi:hypothetical protein
MQVIFELISSSIRGSKTILKHSLESFKAEPLAYDQVKKHWRIESFIR